MIDIVHGLGLQKIWRMENAEHDMVLVFAFSKKIFLVQTSFISAERPMIEFKLLCIHAMNTVEVTDSKVNE